MALTEIPPCPKELSDAAQRGRLVVFIGAGFSRLAGSPGWDDFANTVLQYLARRKVLLDSEFDQLKRLNSPRRRLSIAVELARRRTIDIPYKEILHPAGRSAEIQEDERRLFNALVSTSGVFVTTNYDTWIDDYLKKGEVISVAPATEVEISTPRLALRSFCKPEDFNIDDLGKPCTVFHLHGICTVPDSMVVTTRGYLGLYADFENERVLTSRLRTFLEELFDNYVILFIGYGLEELELLEYIINKARSPAKEPNAGKERRHFLLEGFYSHEQGMIDFLTDYYASQCDVNLEPFNKDRQGYRQLIDVMEAWSKNLSTRGLTGIEVIADVERLSREADV